MKPLRIIKIIKELIANLSRVSKFGYAAQESWIFPGTIRENILVGRAWDEKRYAEILKVTCLETDMLQFPAGDQAYIGDRGITLRSVDTTFHKNS